MGIRIEDAALIGSLSEGYKIPISDGSNKPKVVSAGQIAEFVNQVNNYKPIEADEEDLTSKDGLLQIKDRNSLNGMGYVILRKNKSFKEQVTLPNTIYEIRYDFDLEGEEATIPNNCILKFEGGTINNGTIIANNSIVEGVAGIKCNILGTFLDKNRKRKDIDSEYTEIPTKPYLISTQSELNDILTRVENGENITADLNKGFYKLERSYNLTGSLHLQGNEDVYISYGNEVYKKGDAVEVINNHYKCPLKSKINDFSVFVCDNDIIKLSEISNNDTKVNSTNITIKDYDGEYFKLPITENFIEYSNIETFNNVFGWLDSLWDTIKFSVISSDDEYFYCKRTSNTNVTTLNGDIVTYNSTLNYVIYNLDIKDDEIYYDNDYIYIPNRYNYVEVINKSDYLLTSRNGLYINNINFVNICSCIKVFNSKADINIIGCSFTNILERAILVQGNKTSSDKLVNIIDCTFKNCAVVDSSIIYLQGSVDSKDSNVIIKNCNLSQYTDGFTFFKNAKQGIACHYPATIESCTIYNCVRGGMFLDTGKIEVRDCCLYNTDEFNFYQTRNYSRDLGMIYCNHLFRNDEKALNNVNNTILIERNRIYNFSGKGDTRGIFIDDGRGDVTCMYNVISDNESYSIDSRNVTKFSDGTVYTMSSIRNRLENNLCLTPYRLRYGSGVTDDNVPQSKNFVCSSIINDVGESTDTYLDANSVISKGVHVISALNNKTNLKKVPFIEYTAIQKASIKKRIFFSDKPIVHISFDAKLIANDSPLVINWNNTIGYSISLTIIKYTEQIGFCAKCSGNYLVGRCNFYRDSDDNINIYLAVFDKLKMITRNYGTLEQHSNIQMDINIECLDTFGFPETNLMYCTTFLNREYRTYSLPTVSDDEIKNIIFRGANPLQPNELYTGDGTFYSITSSGIRRTRGTSSERPILDKTKAFYGFRYFDTTLNKPIYWSSEGWVENSDNPVNVVQDLGDSEQDVISQAAITREFNELGSEVNNEISSFKETITNQVNNYKPIEINGDVTNAADEEDITSDESNLLKLKDRNNLNGMGYVILRKNKTFVELLTQTNTIYEIRYDFDLEEGEVNIPTNCVLKFDGGSLSNFANLTLNNTSIVAERKTIFHVGEIINIGNLQTCNGDFSCNITGTLNNDNIYPEWFGAKGDGQTDDSSALQFAINCSYSLGATVLLNSAANAEYKLQHTLYLPPALRIISKNVAPYTYIQETTSPYARITFYDKYCFRTKKKEGQSEQGRLNNPVQVIMDNIKISHGNYSTPAMPAIGESLAVNEVVYNGDVYWSRKTYTFFGVKLSAARITNVISNSGTFLYGSIVAGTRIQSCRIFCSRAFVLGTKATSNNTELIFNIKNAEVRELGYDTSYTRNGRTYVGYNEEVECPTTIGAIIDSYILDNYISGSKQRPIVFGDVQLSHSWITGNFIDFFMSVIATKDANHIGYTYVTNNIIDYCYTFNIGRLRYATITNNRFHYCSHYRMCVELLRMIYWDDWDGVNEPTFGALCNALVHEEQHKATMFVDNIYMAKVDFSYNQFDEVDKLFIQEARGYWDTVRIVNNDVSGETDVEITGLFKQADNAFPGVYPGNKLELDTFKERKYSSYWYFPKPKSDFALKDTISHNTLFNDSVMIDNTYKMRYIVNNDRYSAQTFGSLVRNGSDDGTKALSYTTQTAFNSDAICVDNLTKVWGIVSTNDQDDTTSRNVFMPNGIRARKGVGTTFPTTSNMNDLDIGFPFYNKEAKQYAIWNGTSWVDCAGNPINTKTSGTTSQRPTDISVGFFYLDTTLNKPIWWTGTTWVDATGTNV